MLKGNAQMGCEGFALWADAIEVRFDEEQRFTGAVATGSVTAVEGDTVLRCTRATLEGDRIRGRLDGAIVEVKERSGPIDRLDAIRNRSEIRGDVDKTGARTFTVDGAELTLCDCGDEPASWTLHSTSVDADLDGRANLYWSVLWIAPFGLFEVPITPPIPYISIPFDRRTAGFLPPQFQLFDGFAPQLDLPFFLPIGDSYDLTLSPGIRTDWRTDEGNNLDSYGAPRFGARLRYAPTDGTEGEFELQYQRDAGNKAVRSRRSLEDDDPDPCEGDAPDPSCDFVNRFGVEIQHASALTSYSDFTLVGRWFSDDNLLQDASLSVSDRLNNFTTNRAQLDLHLPLLYAMAGVDYILRLRGQDSPDNIRGEELDTYHRGPHLELRLPPLKVFDGIHVEAIATATRYGAWLTRTFSDEIGLPPAQWVLRSYGGVGYNGGIGPVALRSRIGLDTAWSLPSELGNRAIEQDFEPFDTRDRTVVSLFVEGFAELPFAGKIGSWTHLVVPRAGLRSIPWQDGDATRAALFDPYLDRNELTQAVVALEQSVLDERGEQVARLLIEQPFDLREGDRLQTVVKAQLAPIEPLRLNGNALIATGAETPFRELGAGARATAGPLVTGLSYTRWFADAERFDRSVYEISGTPAFQEFDPDDPGSEQYLSGDAALQLWSFDLRYSFQRLLRRPGGNNNANRITDALPTGPANQRPYTPLQTFGLGYRSPCECWGIRADVVFTQVGVEMPTEDDAFEWDYRINVQFEIGDYVVGTQNR